MPHVQRSCESLPLQFVDARASEDGSFEIELGWTGQMQGIATVRAAVFSLVGGFAEVYTYIRQRRSNAEVTPTSRRSPSGLKANDVIMASTFSMAGSSSAPDPGS